ncbi:autotransporter outer membrane beta-barrel domain-containing protein [Phascolarctobacterium faecium]|uniref:autotransporter outer membrane beta-barrel domain-containing protein n=1 Tax=Phascolarctobacterium faecium TaxID=33025 RepID=UPI003F74AC1B
MYLKTSNKKQLAAAVTLAVMGTAWVAVPGQVWAADGGFGAINNPISLEIYAEQNKSGGKLDTARKNYEGSNVYVSQYHSAYTDNEKIFASGDMTGKTISLSNMTVQAVVGKDGIGQAADLTQHATQGQDGGFGYGAGLVNQNGMSNAVIAVGSAEINVTGGASGLIVDEKYQHEGEQGVTGNAAIGGTGGAGAAGGNGGGAKAIGVAAGITDTAESIVVNGSASKNIQISGTSLTVSATGEAGGHGGYGGKGGSGADGAELTTKKADKGADGADGTDENTTPDKAANGEDKVEHAANGTVTATYNTSMPPEQTGWVSTAGTAGANGNTGTAGANGNNGGDAADGSAGSNGLAGSTGLAGGTGGAGANGGNGGSATAYGLHLNTISGGSVTLNALNVNATGGNGTAGGEGGIGGTGGVGGAGQTGGDGGNGGQGGHGGAGGTAGTAGTSGIGNDASAMAVVLKDTTGVLKTGSITATAVAGKGVGSFSAADAYLLGNSTGDPHDARKAVTDGAGKDGTDGTTVTETDKTQAGYQNGAVNATSNGGEGGGGITPTGDIAQTKNGETATASGLSTIGGTLNVLADNGLAISAEAKDASVNNEAYAVSAAESDNAYVVKGDFKITAKATGDVDLTTAATTSNPKFEYKANQTSTTSIAKAVVINGGSMLADIDGKLEIKAAADKGEAKNWAQGMAVDNAAVQVHTTGAISIKATAATGTWQGAQGIEGNNNDLTFVSDADGIKVTALGGNGTELQKEYAVWLYDSSLTLDAKDAETGIEMNGDVEVITNKTSNSTLNLKSNTKVNGNASDIGGSSKGTLNISGTTMNLTDNLKTLTVADKTTLKGSTVYFYDENNQADKYNTADYRTITTNDLDASATNELFMRTNANGVYGQSAGNDKITSTNTVTGSGTYNITVFDQGMRNGYNNAAGADTKGHLDQDVVLIENADESGTYNIKEMKYDNGVWSYEYEWKAEVVAGGLNLTQVTTRAATQSSAQMAAQDANKIAAGAAVTLFGADETLMERLGDVRNSADDNDGVWAKYVGGKIKVDGLQGDNDYQYNGFAAGYDREIGSNWRIGLAGQYAKGDTSLTNGDGEIKTAAGALYGTWTGDKGHHVDIIAKVGKVDSETSAYGGTIAQKLDGDFGSTAISFAVEYGYRQDLNDGWFVEPMVRASYVHLGGDDYTVTTRDNTMSVTNDSMNSIVLRGGFLLGKTFAADSSVYLKAAVLHDFDGDINTHVSADGRSASYSDSIGGTAIEYGIGVNHKFNKDSSMYLDVERISGGDVTKNWGVNVGFRYSF